MPTNRDYLKALRNDLFDATLLGLMGVETNSAQANVLKQWLNSPIDPSFGDIAASFLDSKLPQLYVSMREYCEIGIGEKQND